MAGKLGRGRIWVSIMSLAGLLIGSLAFRWRDCTPDCLLLAGGLLVAVLAIQFTEGRAADKGNLYGVPALVAGALAAALVLPAGLIAPFVALAALPVGWRRGAWHGLAAAAPAILAALAVFTYIHWVNLQPPVDLLDCVTLLGAALLFLAVFEGLRGTEWLMMGFRVWPYSRSTFVPLTTDALYTVLGAAAVGVWFTAPALLLLAFPALLLVRRVSDTTQLAALADTDAKTGLPNVRYFEREAAAALARDGATGTPTGILFLDLDHFKNVNDTHGHAAGDRVLREAGEVFALALRRRDLIARYGGEEFVALLPDTDTAGALAVAEAVRVAIAAHRFGLSDGTTLHCTASIGVASAPADGTDLAALLAQADGAMYAAKTVRNAVRQTPTLAMGFRPLTPPHEEPGLRSEPRAWTATLAPLVQWTTVFAGGATLCASIYGVTQTGVWLLVPLFGAATVLAWLFPITLYRANGETHSFAFTLAVGMAAITLQPWLAPLVHVIGITAHQIRRRQRQWDKILFNLGNSALSAAVAAVVYSLLRPPGDGFTLMQMLAASTGGLAYYLTNTVLVALMISLYSKKSLREVLRQLWLLLPVEILLGTVGAFIGTVYKTVGIVGVALFLLPLVLMYIVLNTSTRKSQEAIDVLASAKGQVEAAQRAQEQTLTHLIEMLSTVIDARDQQIAGHSRNVARYAGLLATELGLPPEERARIQTAALLHDLGKVAIPEAILQKPAKLTPDEYMTIKEHAAVGRRILADTPLLGPVAVMVGDHHERWDGGGYPRGTQGEQITMGGRIIAVADALDSIVATRVYSRGKTLSWAMREITQCAGEQFDPRVVAALHRVVETIGAEVLLTAEPPVVVLPIVGQPATQPVISGD